ncbi:hypothetical protein, partial [Sphingomonas sp. CCH18-H6]|uniref:hypothetical protein n=1 Tax=Sphingomonas sp. CCH18-H6 TaxID=1768787 RepID=UPI001E5C6C5E
PAKILGRGNRIQQRRVGRGRHDDFSAFVLDPAATRPAGMPEATETEPGKSMSTARDLRFVIAF